MFYYIYTSQKLNCPHCLFKFLKTPSWEFPTLLWKLASPKNPYFALKLTGLYHGSEYSLSPKRSLELRKLSNSKRFHLTPKTNYLRTAPFTWKSCLAQKWCPYFRLADNDFYEEWVITRIKQNANLFPSLIYQCIRHFKLF